MVLHRDRYPALQRDFVDPEQAVSLLRRALEEFDGGISHLSIDPAGDQVGESSVEARARTLLLRRVVSRRGVTEATVDPSDRDGVEAFCRFAHRSNLATVWRIDARREFFESADSGIASYYLSPTEHRRLIEIADVEDLALPSRWFIAP